MQLMDLSYRIYPLAYHNLYGVQNTWASNDCHFGDNIFKCPFVNSNFIIRFKLPKY